MTQRDQSLRWIKSFEELFSRVKTTKDGVTISLQAELFSKDPKAGKRVRKALNDFMKAIG